MSDAVMVPREPTEAMIAAADCAGMAFAGSDLDSADMTRMIWSAMLAASPQGEGSPGDPAPIKPSGDTGELRDRVARVIHPKPWSEDYELADAILDLIQSERAG